MPEVDKGAAHSCEQLGRLVKSAVTKLWGQSLNTLVPFNMWPYQGKLEDMLLWLHLIALTEVIFTSKTNQSMFFFPPLLCFLGFGKATPV